MRKRHSMGRGHSRRVFTKGAKKIHRLNTVRPSRGGIRL